MSNIAVFPGSFSPFTIGHEAIINKALPLFDKIIIAIGINSKKDKYFSVKKRLEWIESVYKDNSKIEIVKYKGLTVDLCKRKNAHYILRGLRNTNDFLYEQTIAQTNKNLNNKIETIFLTTPANISHISSSLIREIIQNGGDTNQFLPKEINL